MRVFGASRCARLLTEKRLTENVEEHFVQRRIAAYATIEAMVLFFDVRDAQGSLLMVGTVHGQNTESTVSNGDHRIETDNVRPIIPNPDDLERHGWQSKTSIKCTKAISCCVTINECVHSEIFIRSPAVRRVYCS